MCLVEQAACRKIRSMTRITQIVIDSIASAYRDANFPSATGVWQCGHVPRLTRTPNGVAALAVLVRGHFSGLPISPECPPKIRRHCARIMSDPQSGEGPTIQCLHKPSEHLEDLR